jgi:hypothetical protein
MVRVPIWAITLMFVAGMSLAAPPSLELPVRDPQPERPTFSEDWSLEGLVLSAEEEATEEFVIAGKRSKRGGSRGGAREKRHGGFKSGSKRQAQRGGDRGGRGRSGGRGGRSGDVDRDVNIDRDVDFDDDNDVARAAIVGGVIGLGVGAALADEPDPGYVEHPEAY